MPFRAEVLPGGRVRFRFWAPRAATVELCLDAAGEAPRALRPEADGWFETTVERAGRGTRYRYRIDGTLRGPDPAPRFPPPDVHGPRGGGRRGGPLVLPRPPPRPVPPGGHAGGARAPPRSPRRPRCHRARADAAR